MVKVIAAITSAMSIASVHADEVENRISKMVATVAPSIEVVKASESPVDNIMKVELSNGQFVYVTRDAEYMFPGKLLQHTEDGMKDLTEHDLALNRKDQLKKIDLADTITFGASGDELAEIFVFTDVSCGYCKKLHRDIDSINEAGITVHYLAFPRAGAQSPTGRLMSDVWCSKNPKSAITKVKADEALTQNPGACSDPVASQHKIGLALGVTGTPGIYDKEGRHLGGYLTTDQLKNAFK